MKWRSRNPWPILGIEVVAPWEKWPIFMRLVRFFFSFPWILEGNFGDDLLNFDGIFLFWEDIFNGTMMGLIGLLWVLWNLVGVISQSGCWCPALWMSVFTKQWLTVLGSCVCVCRTCGAKHQTLPSPSSKEHPLASFRCPFEMPVSKPDIAR